MRIKINGYTPKEQEPVDLDKCTIDYWFTAGGVRWTACLRDEEGNQVGEAIFAYHKSGVTNLKKTDFIIDQPTNLS